MHPIFNLRVPKSCPGVDSRILNPRNMWGDIVAYDSAAGRVRDMFRANFKNNNFAAFGIDAVL